jgi:hypothetical protein
MAYFTCEHGSKYFPFGKGGREKLLRGLSGAGSQSSGNVLDQLMTCPMQSLPLVLEPEVTEGWHGVLGLDECHSGCDHDESVKTNGFGFDNEFVAPVVLREPQSESTLIYHMLASDVLSEIFKAQTEAILVRIHSCHMMFIHYSLIDTRGELQRENAVISAAVLHCKWRIGAGCPN